MTRCTWPVVLKRPDDLVKLVPCSRTTGYERNLCKLSRSFPVSASLCVLSQIVDVSVSQIGRARRAGEVEESNSGPSSNRGVPVPQTMEERVRQCTGADYRRPCTTVYERYSEGAQITPRERISVRIFTDCRCASASKLEDVVDLLRLTSATADLQANRGCVFPQIMCTRSVSHAHFSDTFSLRGVQTSHAWLKVFALTFSLLMFHFTVFAVPARSLRHFVPVCTFLAELFPIRKRQAHFRVSAEESGYRRTPQITEQNMCKLS